MRRARPATRGFVLVNALVMVAALSVVALALLSRAEDGRLQVLATSQAVQLELNLDAYEALARAMLTADPGGADHLREAWARDDNDLPLERGRVAGRMRDLQGAFNLNWLANPEDEASRDAFDRLLLQLGVAPRVGDMIVAQLAPGGSSQIRSARATGVAEDPPGGVALMLDQLSIPSRDLARLSPHVTVLPGGSRLNVNTTSPQVLASFLPGVNVAALDALFSQRRTEPFLSVDDFIARMVETLGAEQAAALDRERIGVASDWFEVEITARLEGREATRLAVLRRFPLPEGAKVAYRLDKW